MWIDLVFFILGLVLVIGLIITWWNLQTVWDEAQTNDRLIRRLEESLVGPDGDVLDQPTSIQHQIEKLQKGLYVDVPKKLRRHTGQISEHGRRIDEVETALANLLDDFTALSDALSNESTRREATDEVVDELRKKIDQLRETTDGSHNRIDHIWSRLEEITENIDAIEQRSDNDRRALEDLWTHYRRLNKHLWGALVTWKALTEADPRWDGMAPSVREHLTDFHRAFDECLDVLEERGMWTGDPPAEAEGEAIMQMSDITDEGPIQRDDVEDLPVRKYRKTRLLRAVRMEGPFTVETREGTLTCADGYLAVDSAGHPYPIAKEEFQQIYAPT